MEEGRWRHWIALAGCFFGMLYANPASAYFVASLGGAVALCLAWRAFVRRNEEARSGLARLGICGAAAFLIFVPLVWPALPQAAGYLKEKMQGSIGGVWPISAWSRYASGVMMPDAEVGREWLNFAVEEGDEAIRRSAGAFMLEHYLPEEPWLFCVTFVLFPALMVLGAMAFFRRHPAAWPVLAGGIAAPLLAYSMHHWLLYTFIYYWYLIYAMPVILMLLALGSEAVGHFLEKRWRSDRLTWIPPLAVAAILISVNLGGTGRMRWTLTKVEVPQQFDRGRYLWTTYPDGKTVREPDPNGK
jgi:hypothetical protein